MVKSRSIILNPILVQGALYIYMLAILVVAVFPFSAAGMRSVNSVYVVSFRLDHLLHLVIFAPMFPILRLNSRVFSPKNSFILLMIALSLAITTEGVQHFVSWRTFNPADLIANVGGALLGFLMWLPIQRFFRVTPIS